ncbi:MAG: hypothetical protein Q8N99_01125 [Nanoarchaeota archaeon]|nr:hypothetical protein [Nanoarchaeota archaeon]
MTATITADRLEAYLNEENFSKKTWMGDFLGDLPKDPRIDNGLLETLVDIASKAYYTTMEDSGFQDDGISLSSLNQHRERIGNDVIDDVLNQFQHSSPGSIFIPYYIIKYIGKYKQEGMIPFLQDLMDKCCRYSSSLACDARDALKEMDTEHSRKVLAERGECNCRNQKSR